MKLNPIWYGTAQNATSTYELELTPPTLTAEGTQVPQTTPLQGPRGHAPGGSPLTVCVQLARDALQRR